MKRPTITYFVNVMLETLDKLAEEALQLPPELRAELADILVGSLETVPSDEIQDAWTKVAVRRWKEIESGEVETIPGKEVLAEVRKLVGR